MDWYSCFQLPESRKAILTEPLVSRDSLFAPLSVDSAQSTDAAKTQVNRSDADHRSYGNANKTVTELDPGPRVK